MVQKAVSSLSPAGRDLVTYNRIHINGLNTSRIMVQCCASIFSASWRSLLCYACYFFAQQVSVSWIHIHYISPQYLLQKSFTKNQSLNEERCCWDLLQLYTKMGTPGTLLTCYSKPAASHKDFVSLLSVILRQTAVAEECRAMKKASLLEFSLSSSETLLPPSTKGEGQQWNGSSQERA